MMHAVVLLTNVGFVQRQCVSVTVTQSPMSGLVTHGREQAVEVGELTERAGMGEWWKRGLAWVAVLPREEARESGCNSAKEGDRDSGETHVNSGPKENGGTKNEGEESGGGERATKKKNINPSFAHFIREDAMWDPKPGVGVLISCTRIAPYGSRPS